ncbi:MAG: hypothetical protein WC975_10530 [Phycisphaerae bacterium]
MSTIPPSNANLVTGVVQTTVSQKQRATEKASVEKQLAQQAREQAFLSDQQEHQVEDTLHTEDNIIVRKHNEEESHQQRKHRHRKLPEDNKPSDASDDPQQKPDHIDLQA